MPFKPGQSGNPAGKPKGAKNKLTEAFWRDFAEAWKARGRAALEEVAINDPATFVRVAGSLMPKELDIAANGQHVLSAKPLQLEDWQKRYADKPKVIRDPGQLSQYERCGANLALVGRIHRCVANTMTYQHRDSVKRRAYMRDYMRRRRVSNCEHTDTHNG